MLLLYAPDGISLKSAERQRYPNIVFAKKLAAFFMTFEYVQFKI